MAEATPLATTIDAFDSARGEELDGVWAFSTSWALLVRDVDVSLVDEGLREALALVRESQESPEDLFGDARQHADTLYDGWVEEGRLVLDDDSGSWRDAIVTGLVLSALVAAIMVVLLLVRGELHTAPAARVAGLSLVVGLGSSLGRAAWSRRHRRPAPGPDAPDDARWSVELTEILRSRHSMSGERVRDMVAEARAHAAESGRTLEEELGTPEEYAARFAPDLLRRSRWRLAALVTMALLSAALFVDEGSWSTGVLTMIWSWWALTEARAQASRRHR